MSSGNNEELDLRLALGYSDQNNNASRVNNESGAGVNAGTEVDMTFAASDPLSELVWSPHKGLSLKCTGSALADKKPFLLWNVGASNVTHHHSPSQTNIFEEGVDEEGKGKLLVTKAMSQLDMEDAQRIHLGKSSSKNVLAPRSSCGNEMGNSNGRERLNTEIVDTNKTAENLSKKRKKDVSAPQHIQITESDKYNAGPGEERALKSLHHVAEDTASGNQILGLGLTVSSEIHSSRKLGPQLAPSLNLIPQQESNEKAVSVEEESGGKKDHLEKQESSAENDKQNLIAKEAEEQNEKRDMRDNSVPLETSLTLSKALRRRKGKEKVFSDGNGNGNSRMLSNEEDSHESVDSCNSIRMLLPQGKRQLQLEQPLLVGGKRIKTEMQGHNASTSNVGNDSSFMTWISNMINGFSKTNREEAPLPLSLAHSLAGNERNSGEIITYGRNHDVERNNTGFQTMFHSLLCPPSATPEPRTLKDDPSTGESKEIILPGNDESNRGEIVAYDKNHNSGSENTGFQSMFRSLFRPASVMPEKRILKDDPPTRESKEVVLADKMIIEASPISCHRESSGSDEQIFVSSDKVITSALAHRDGISTKFPIKPFNVGPTWDACKSTSTEKKSSGNSSSRKTTEGGNKKSSGNSSSRKTTEGGNSSGSLRKIKTRNGNNNSSSYPSESKAVKDLSNRSVSHGNLWITRFCVKDHPTTMNLDEFKENKDETPDCTRPNPNAQVSSEFLIDQKGQEPREYSTHEGNAMYKTMQSHTLNPDPSTGSMEIHAFHNPKFPTPKLKSSEAMASLFARRLDAIKHIVPSTPQNEVTCSRTTCFFCGRRGHDLRNCSEVTETELESLLRNVSSYDGAEDFHSLCIRCLQLDHWAITCPLESSGKQQQQEQGNSFLNRYCASNLHIRPADDEKYPNFLAKVQGDPSILSNHIGNGTDADNLIPNGKWISFERMVESIKVKENMAPDLVENVLNENNFLPLPSSTFGSNDIGGIPKGAFDAIRRIRLSRGTILKWINSKSSLSHLDGFFLRLRIGKQEADLGRTGYYVARIAGTQKENPTTDSKKFIPVSVGSVKCFVGCQYVSNHDFLEDELLAWWSRTSESGGKVPSEDELRLKLEERMKLGF